MQNTDRMASALAATAANAGLNQSPVFENVNLFATDRPLREAVARNGAGWAKDELDQLGRIAGSAHVLELGRLANENPPKARLIDQKGRRIDRVEFHPAYDELMEISFRHGLHCRGWEDAAAGRPQRAGVHVARAAGLYMVSQAEAGHMCPITMTHAAVATLRLDDAMLQRLMPKILSREYDPSFQPIDGKVSVTIGMGMTEKQGGTDVRANVTAAEPLGGGRYSITGHKWFMSAPMCDAFLVLAQAPGGLSCFFMPRFRADGSLNAIRIERLKDKLGNRSNASSEVTFLGAEATLVGEEGRGVPAIIEMVTLTRLDCAVSSAALMRFTLANAVRHTKSRTVFQRKLIDQPLMANVLSDLAIQSEAATALAMRLARSFDRAESDPQEAAFRRLMTPVAKYWICKSVPAFAYEAMECMGGNGYVEEGLLARAYREAPLNAIWEGSGNVMCLDLLRVMQKEPQAVDAVLAEIEPAARGQPNLRAAIDELKTALASRAMPESDARWLIEKLALIAASALLTAHAPPEVAEPFAATRLAGGWRQTYGAGLRGANHHAILARAGEGL